MDCDNLLNELDFHWTVNHTHCLCHHLAIHPSLTQVAVLTNGSADGVAKPALTAGGAIQLVKGPLLDINMAQVR